MQERTLLKLRYGAPFYFLHLGYLAYLIAYLPLQLEEMGASPQFIAFSALLLNLSAILGSYIASQLFAQISSALTWIRTSLYLMLGFQFLFCFTSSLWWILGLLFILGIAHKTQGVLYDTQLVQHASKGLLRFENFRIWGSLGYIALSFVFGVAIDWFGSASLSVVALLSLLPLLPLLLILSEPKREQEDNLQQTTTVAIQALSGKLGTIWNRKFLLFLIAVLISWSSSGVFYVFFSVYLKELGCSGFQISVAWAVAVFSEIILFLQFNRLEKRYDLLSIFRISLLISAVRWGILAVTNNWLILLGSQALHAFSFGSFYLASVKLAHHLLPIEQRDAGQGLLWAFGVGAGSLLGRLYALFIMQSSQSLSVIPLMFAVSMLVAGAAYLVSLCINSEKKIFSPSPC